MKRPQRTPEAQARDRPVSGAQRCLDLFERRHGLLDRPAGRLGEELEVGRRQVALEEREELQVEPLLGGERRPEVGRGPLDGLGLGGPRIGQDVLQHPSVVAHRRAERDRLEVVLGTLPVEEEPLQDVVGEEVAELHAVAPLEGPHAREDPVVLEDVHVEVGRPLGRDAVEADGEGVDVGPELVLEAPAG